ncbi:tyrosine-type recombinase/integrase [Alkalihalobacillus deserti]|uniref:tyrosine-type recombinase/integrase n=1 Tax=Alkalihalobacillus deserti TaxID=2879466 RepID=UPI001D149EB1|nr:site-specific integrase [Alkalihalobacillus deserti]
MKKHNSTNVVSIEDKALPTWTLRTALEEMREYRTWEESTFKAYLRDVDSFEDFSLKEGFEPTLETIKLHHIAKFMKRATENKVAYKTTKRVIASLSSVFTFYQDIGTVKGNPFKASDLPVGEVGHHSRALEFEEIVDVYEALQRIKEKEGKDLLVTTEVLLYTGLRNHALSTIKVKDVWLEKELIHYDPGVINGKHTIQYFAVPPKLMEKIKTHIKYYQLEPNDKLLHGLKGLPLQNKQLNRVTDRINKELGWVDDKHVTPHGYRASIATMLDERGVDRDFIKYLLGHSITKDNITQYLRRDNRKIRALRNELTQIEKDIYQALDKRLAKDTEEGTNEHDIIRGNVDEGAASHNPSQVTSQGTISMKEFVELTKVNPQLAQKLAEMNLVAM